MSFNEARAISVRINGTRVANVESIISSSKREKNVSGSVINVQSKEISVTLKRVIYLNDTRSDGLLLRAQNNFLLEIYYPDHISSYTNCQWVDYTETVGENNTVTEEIKICSLNYSQVSR